MDDNGHGTEVAGIIGAVGNNGIGITGVDWNVQVLPLKFMDASGAGYTSDAVSALAYVDTLHSEGVNIKVVNASWDGGYSIALDLEVQQLDTDGILLVAGAGNSGNNNDVTPTYPATLQEDNVISVAATDSNDQLASFSNYGPTTVDLAAPGVNILSTQLGGGYTDGDGHELCHAVRLGSCGTGICLRSHRHRRGCQGRALINGADPLPSLAGKVLSGGWLDVYNTLNLLSPAPTGTGLSTTWYASKDLSGNRRTRGHRPGQLQLACGLCPNPNIPINQWSGQLGLAKFSRSSPRITPSTHWTIICWRLLGRLSADHQPLGGITAWLLAISTVMASLTPWTWPGSLRSIPRASISSPNTT